MHISTLITQNSPFLRFNQLNLDLKSLCISSNFSEFMESAIVPCARLLTITTNKEKIEVSVFQTREQKDSGNALRPNHSFQFHCTGALEILRETVRILRFNSIAFIAIVAILIYPVSAVHLSSILVDQLTVKKLALKLQFIAKSSGITLNSFVKQSCHKISDMAISSMVLFPLNCTLLLISKAAVVYTVDCTYSQKKSNPFKFFSIVRTIWRRIVSVYLLICALIVGCIVLFVMLIICISRLFYIIGFLPNSSAYITVIIGLFFLVFLARTMIICDLSLVMSVLEDVSGDQALMRSSVLIRGQTQVGLMIYLGSTIGMAMVKGCFEHLVIRLSYGDGLSRTWEQQVLVLVYCFVVLIDFMMSTVFYFSCTSRSLEVSSVECKKVLETELSCNKV